MWRTNNSIRCLKVWSNFLVHSYHINFYSCIFIQRHLNWVIVTTRTSAIFILIKDRATNFSQFTSTEISVISQILINSQQFCALFLFKCHIFTHGVKEPFCETFLSATSLCVTWIKANAISFVGIHFGLGLSSWAKHKFDHLERTVAHNDTNPWQVRT